MSNKWTIAYDNDCGFRDESFSEWWDVTDGEHKFRATSKWEAEWLCDKLNNAEAAQ